MKRYTPLNLFVGYVGQIDGRFVTYWPSSPMGRFMVFRRKWLWTVKQRCLLILGDGLKQRYSFWDVNQADKKHLFDVSEYRLTIEGEVIEQRERPKPRKPNGEYEFGRSSGPPYDWKIKVNRVISCTKITK